MTFSRERVGNSTIRTSEACSLDTPVQNQDYHTFPNHLSRCSLCFRVPCFFVHYPISTWTPLPRAGRIWDLFSHLFTWLPCLKPHCQPFGLLCIGQNKSGSVTNHYEIQERTLFFCLHVSTPLTHTHRESYPQETFHKWNTTVLLSGFDLCKIWYQNHLHSSTSYNSSSCADYGKLFNHSLSWFIIYEVISLVLTSVCSCSSQ